MRIIDKIIRASERREDVASFIGFCLGILIVFLWNSIYLNSSARNNVLLSFVNTVIICTFATLFSFVIGWGTAIVLDYARKRNRLVHFCAGFVVNIIRSVPQIIGVLFAYILISRLSINGMVQSNLLLFILSGFSLALFMFPEISDLITERITYFRQLDFYDAMLVCGVSERRIVNYDILYKNSRLHIINKLISVFGIAIFLQCSVDFIISVGLSNSVSSVNLPVTLGSMLAKMDSKQDILAVGYTLTHPFYAINLPFKHLQGISTAFLLAFTLYSMFIISKRYAQRHNL
jgi:ABC-type dipeptide/oligopeptide/nickel transport system permease component